MPSSSSETSTARRSLKANYILFSLIAAVILAAGSAITSFYISRVTQENARALQLRDDVTASVQKIRKANQHLESTLSAMVVSPQDGYPQRISRALQQTIEQIRVLRGYSLAHVPTATTAIEDLYNDALELQKYTLQLLKNIQDSDWVYPMLPYINDILLESNTEFESAATLALQEIASDDDGDTYASGLYREMAQLRDLWRLQILNFRAAIVRFAGLNRIERIPQEQNIELVNKEIRNKIEKLQKRKDLGFETQDALKVMAYRARKWYEDYTRLQEIRSSKIWRADIHFIDTYMRPLQAHIHDDLERLEQAVLDWSSKTTTKVEAAAQKVNLELWGITFAAVLFVVMIYVLISRTVLTPLRIIADAITEEGKSIEHIALPSKSSREIHALMTAYNTMRRQIHHRQMALEYQALHDALTGLPNRALLQDRLTQTIQQAKRHHTSIAFMLLDLDRFKYINDTLGHAMGDRVLQEIAQRLNKCLRSSDTVARLGGDEFAIISPDVDTAQASFFVEKVIHEVQRSINIDQQNLHVGVSIGIALFPDHGDDADTLMRHADIAMYDAKRNKKGYSFFDTTQKEMDIFSLSLLGELRETLAQSSDALSLHYQPQIDIRDNTIRSVEALLRWKHPTHGMLPPDDVVHLCEQSGLIRELTHWVLEKAMSDCKAWEKDGLILGIAVNLSMWNLQDADLPAHINQLLKEHELAADRLTLEITESAVMNDPTRTRETLSKLSSMGIQLDIDDYGTGFSSLAYLKMLPVKGLKIDKSFVIDMQEDENDDTIVQSTIDLAHNLNLVVVAEGVESSEALNALKSYQCNYAQGYFIARPMPADRLPYWYTDYGKPA
ncbi:MAG TPA: EAL domain-containing protein [Gammaproteobacteria bacterium]|nr:EAL domain-containing protein [Gammaproteobacteria bacterium]